MISVSHPLDYEQIPNGLIYLTVMAKDAGNPPLNSTVPVTIEVFVSTQGHWPCPSTAQGVIWQTGPKAVLENLCQLGQGRSRNARRAQLLKSGSDFF